MARLLDDVLDYLEAEGLVGGATNWKRSEGYLPTAPDRVVAVFEAGGTPPDSAPTGSTETVYDELDFQVQLRGQPRTTSGFYAELRAQAEAIYIALHESQLSPASGDPAYVDVRATQAGPTPLGLDDRDRPRLAWNFRALRERPVA